MTNQYLIVNCAYVALMVACTACASRSLPWTTGSQGPYARPQPATAASSSLILRGFACMFYVCAWDWCLYWWMYWTNVLSFSCALSNLSQLSLTLQDSSHPVSKNYAFTNNYASYIWLWQADVFTCSHCAHMLHVLSCAHMLPLLPCGLRTCKARGWL